MAAQPVGGVSQQRPGPVVLKRPLCHPLLEPLKVAGAAVAKAADHYRFGVALGDEVTIAAQAIGVDAVRVDAQLLADQLGGRGRQLGQIGGEEAQPPQRGDLRGKREPQPRRPPCEDGRKLILAEDEEGVQCPLVDLLREALPLGALCGAEDLNGHQNSISKAATAACRSACEGRL